MAFTANTAFEARIVNDRFDDLANIAGKFYVSTTATDCDAGQLCIRDSLLNCEGFANVKNENAWKMVTAEDDTPATTPIYACDPHDWPLIGNSRNLWAVGTETLGLGIPFENGNLRLLTQNLYEGLQAYKLKHDIKDDLRDQEIQLPYSATNRLARQISNLQKKYGAIGWTEQQINKYIQKDMWSALLYACRIAQRLEKAELYYQNRRKNEWEELAKQYSGITGEYAINPNGKKRRSGRLGVR